MVKITRTASGGVRLSSGGVKMAFDEDAIHNADWGTIRISVSGGRLKVIVGTVPENVLAGIVYAEAVDAGTVLRQAFFFFPEPGEEIDLGPAPTEITEVAGWKGYIAPLSEGEDGYIHIGTPVTGSEVTETPAGPGAVNFSVATGAANGQITITLLAPLPSGGDGATAGDGLGVLNGVYYRIDGGSEVLFGSLTPNHVVTVGGLTPGGVVGVQMRSQSSSRAGGWSVPKNVTVKEVVGNPPVFKGKPATMHPVQGTSFVFDVATLFTGTGITYSIEGAGLTGGSLSGSNYSVSALTLETATVLVRATNSFGSVLGEFDVAVVAAGAAPVWQTAAIPDVIVPINGTIDVDLSQYIVGGSTPITFSVPSNAYTEIVDGRYRNKAGATASAVALTTQTLTATNGTGNATKQIRFRVVAKAAKLVLNTDVRIKRSDYAFSGDTGWWKPVVEFPTNLDAAAGVTSVIWSTSDPDASGNIDIALYDVLTQTSSSPKEYKSFMMDSWRNGDPDDQVASTSLANDPISTVNGSPNVKVRVPSLADIQVGRRVRLQGHTEVGGLTPAGFYPVDSINTADNSFTIVMGSNATSTADGGGNAVTLTRNRVDYSVFGAGEARGTKFRVARIIAGVVSEWSDEMTVPNVIDEPTVPGDSDVWLPYVFRPAATYPLVGSPGMQFQHVVAWNMGRNDASKAGYAIFGQDENNCSYTPDYGATTAPLHALGMCGSKIGGAWLNSDDNVMAVLCGAGFNTGIAGVYISRDWGKTFSRMNLSGFASIISEGGRMSVNQNLIDRRPQNDAGTLTHAQRPAYWIEQGVGTFAATAPVNKCRLWRSTDNFQSAEVVYTFTPSQIASGEYGLYYLRVAPNGDVIVGGSQGVWYSSNASSGSVSFSKVYNGTIRGLSVYGNGNNSAGYIAVSGAVRHSSNIGTNDFTVPGGQNLPSGTVTQVQCCLYNPAKVYCTSDGNGNGYVSTNSGASWSVVSTTKQTGEPNANRWKFDQRAAGIYPHPYDSTKHIAFTTQSFTRAKTGTTFHGDDTAYWDKTHIKGGFGPHISDPDKICLMAQDRGPAFTNGRGVQDIEFTYLSRNDSVQNQAGNSKSLSQHVLDATGKTGGKADTGRGNWPYPNNDNKTLAFWCQDGGAVTAAPVIHTRSGGNWGTTRVFTNVGGSRVDKQFWSPVEDNVLFAGRWTFSGWSATDTQLSIGTQSRGVMGYSRVGNTFETYWAEEGGATQIYRSTQNRGGGQTSWRSGVPSFDILASAVNPGRLGHIVFSPNNGDGKVYDIQDGGAPRLLVDLKARTQTIFNQKNISTAIPGTFKVWQIEANPCATGVFYVVIECCGVPCVWLITFDNNMNATTVRYDTGLPLTIGWLRCHHLTGEAVFFSSQGSFLMKAPPGVPNSLQYKNRHWNWLVNYYARSDVPNPTNHLMVA